MEGLQLKIMSLPANIVDKLKAEAKESNLGSFTSFECLAAYLWKARTKADKRQSADKEVVLRFRVNVRARMVPKLPPSSFGALVIHGEVEGVKAGEIREESLGATATRIHEAIGWYTDPVRIEKELANYEAGRQPGKENKESMVVTEIIDTRKAGLYDAQFSWGEVRAFRPATPSNGAGIISLCSPLPCPPSNEGGGRHDSNGLEVVLRLTTIEMEGLLPTLSSSNS